MSRKKSRPISEFHTFHKLKRSKLVSAILFFSSSKWHMAKDAFVLVERVVEVLVLSLLVGYSALKVLARRQVRSTLCVSPSDVFSDNAARK